MHVSALLELNFESSYLCQTAGELAALRFIQTTDIYLTAT